MPKNIQTTVYTFDELSAKAKEKARDWFRATLYDDYSFKWENVKEDAALIGLALESYDCDSASFIRNMQGEFTKPAEVVAELIHVNHGDECATYKTATKFFNARSTARETIDIEICEKGFLACLLTDYSKMLQSEFEYCDSDEYIDESITANNYTFLESGKRFG